MSFKNRQLLLKTRPEGLVSLDHFDLHETTTAELTDGQAGRLWGGESGGPRLRLGRSGGSPGGPPRW